MTDANIDETEEFQAHGKAVRNLVSVVMVTINTFNIDPRVVVDALGTVVGLAALRIEKQLGEPFDIDGYVEAIKRLIELQRAHETWINTATGTVN